MWRRPGEAWTVVVSSHLLLKYRHSEVVVGSSEQLDCCTGRCFESERFETIRWQCKRRQLCGVHQAIRLTFGAKYRSKSRERDGYRCVITRGITKVRWASLRAGYLREHCREHRWIGVLVEYLRERLLPISLIPPAGVEEKARARTTRLLLQEGLRAKAWKNE